MQSEIFHVLSYYDLFQYPPKLGEIHASLRVKTELDELRTELHKLVKQHLIVSDGKRYAMNSEILLSYTPKERHSKALTAQFRRIYQVFTVLPTVHLIGISGSLSMSDADFKDDIDLFVVTKGNTLWISRFYLLFVTRLMSFFGNRLARKLCWNIFMEEPNLALPKKKQNEYTAHELIQLKILYDRSQTSQDLRKQNQWIRKILPNVQINYRKNTTSYKPSEQHKMLIEVDSFFRNFQLKWLKKKGYKAIEYPSQVWFIQDDFERKIPFKLKKI